MYKLCKIYFDVIRDNIYGFMKMILCSFLNFFFKCLKYVLMGCLVEERFLLNCCWFVLSWLW